jgi:hypothetical protein
MVAYIGRRATSRPSFTSSATQSDASPAPPRAAARGARSFPIAVNGTSTTCGFVSAIACASAEA